MPHFDRNLWRAADRIVAALQHQQRKARLPKLPVESWAALAGLTHQLRVARQRGWTAATNQLLPTFESQLRWLIDDLKRLNLRPLQSTGDNPLRAREVYDELHAVSDRFEGFTVDLANTQVSVLTEPISLDDIDLGPFQLVWNWSRLAEGEALRVIAESPRPPECDENVTHPHVRDGVLCEGEARLSLELASHSGRLFDYFEIVERVLKTYNAGSAYVSLSEWDNVRCSSCNDACDADDLSSCEVCYDPLCSSCLTECNACGRLLCRSCSLVCLVCHEPMCPKCRATQFGRPVCSTCLQKEISHDDDDHSPSVAADETKNDLAVHADRVGQAAVPARCR